MERADAARNREAVLDAAARLFERDGADAVTLAAVATEAGVGKGTVYRRFGDRTGLIEAVIEPRVTALRAALHTGPPPLGPGGEPTAALHAYLDALFDFVLANRSLIRALERRGPDAYYANPVSRFWIAELRRRIAAAQPGADADYLAYAAFTMLRADVVDYLHGRRMTYQRVRQGLHALLT